MDRTRVYTALPGRRRRRWRSVGHKRRAWATRRTGAGFVPFRCLQRNQRGITEESEGNPRESKRSHRRDKGNQRESKRKPEGNQSEIDRDRGPVGRLLTRRQTKLGELTVKGSGCQISHISFRILPNNEHQPGGPQILYRTRTSKLRKRA